MMIIIFFLLVSSSISQLFSKLVITTDPLMQRSAGFYDSLDVLFVHNGDGMGEVDTKLKWKESYVDEYLHFDGYLAVCSPKSSGWVGTVTLTRSDGSVISSGRVCLASVFSGSFGNKKCNQVQTSISSSRRGATYDPAIPVDHRGHCVYILGKEGKAFTDGWSVDHPDFKPDELLDEIHDSDLTEVTVRATPDPDFYPDPSGRRAAEESPPQASELQIISDADFKKQIPLVVEVYGATSAKIKILDQLKVCNLKFKHWEGSISIHLADGTWFSTGTDIGYSTVCIGSEWHSYCDQTLGFHFTESGNCVYFDLDKAIAEGGGDKNYHPQTDGSRIGEKWVNEHQKAVVTVKSGNNPSAIATQLEILTDDPTYTKTIDGKNGVVTKVENVPFVGSIQVCDKSGGVFFGSVEIDVVGAKWPPVKLHSAPEICLSSKWSVYGNCVPHVKTGKSGKCVTFNVVDFNLGKEEELITDGYYTAKELTSNVYINIATKRKYSYKERKNSFTDATNTIWVDWFSTPKLILTTDLGYTQTLTTGATGDFSMNDIPFKHSFKVCNPSGNAWAGVVYLGGIKTDLICLSKDWKDYGECEGEEHWRGPTGRTEVFKCKDSGRCWYYFNVNGVQSHYTDGYKAIEIDGKSSSDTCSNVFEKIIKKDVT